MLQFVSAVLKHTVSALIKRWSEMLNKNVWILLNRTEDSKQQTRSASEREDLTTLTGLLWEPSCISLLSPSSAPFLWCCLSVQGLNPSTDRPLRSLKASPSARPSNTASTGAEWLQSSQPPLRNPPWHSPVILWFLFVEDNTVMQLEKRIQNKITDLWTHFTHLRN